jgi:hypothetical protein
VWIWPSPPFLERVTRPPGRHPAHVNVAHLRIEGATVTLCSIAGTELWEPPPAGALPCASCARAIVDDTPAVLTVTPRPS